MMGICRDEVLKVGMLLLNVLKKLIIAGLVYFVPSIMLNLDSVDGIIAI